ncbi:MAG TPA: transketolase [Solirubrobacteraceae bacterium]|jgi:transketolase
MTPPTSLAIKQDARSLDRLADLDQNCVDTIRTLAIDAVQRANSGHPGMPMAMAPVAYLLFAQVMRHNPADPAWPDRDRFVLSAGHGSMLLYAALHLSGYELSLEDLKSFRQWDSRTPGHPEHGLTPGVETTTGPLGQGFANGVGMGLAERFLRERYGSHVCDHRIYALCSDGDLMEGISSEAASLAGQLGLGRLVYLYDDNGITIDGATDLSFGREDVGARFAAYGWHFERVEDVNDLPSLRHAIALAIAEDERPSLIAVRSVIGYGAPTKAGTAAAHGAALGEDEARGAKLALGRDADQEFHVPAAVYEAFDARRRGARLESEWERGMAEWRASSPVASAEWESAQAGRPLQGLAEALQTAARAPVPDGAKVATRVASGNAMQALAPFVPTMVGGSADLAASVGTRFDGEPHYSRAAAGRNIHWGVREHAMAAAVNGLALHGGIMRPYGSTFLQFSDYMRPAIRLSALMGLPVAWVFSHDSVAVGEDGPTHQPIEHLAALRAIPGLTVIRPCDAAEATVAWQATLELVAGPACLVLSRQGLPGLDRAELAPADGLLHGGYVLTGGAWQPDVVLVGTGSEVHVALAARELLAREGLAARVVSMPSLELFAAQDEDYRALVLPPGVPSVSVEAGVAQGWERWVDESVSIEWFGASAPGPVVMERLGMTPAAVAVAARRVVTARARRRSPGLRRRRP